MTKATKKKTLKLKDVEAIPYKYYYVVFLYLFMLFCDSYVSVSTIIMLDYTGRA